MTNEALKIRTLADVKRAFAIPGVLVFTDRNDFKAARLVRDPDAMATTSAPRRVIKVRSAYVMIGSPERPTYLTLPKSKDLRTDGTNVFTFVHNETDGQPAKLLTYRLEMPDTAGALTPSMLPLSHPPMDNEDIDSEVAARIAAEAKERQEREAYAAKYAQISALPASEADPRYAVLQAATEAAVAAVLDDGVNYLTAMYQGVQDRTADTEFAVFKQMPDIDLQGQVDQQAIQLVTKRAFYDLSHLPRGTWQVIRLTSYKSASSSWCGKTAMSTGGARPAWIVEGVDTAESAYGNMRRREVYDARGQVEFERQLVSSVKAIERCGFAVGQTYKAFRYQGAMYSVATITTITQANGKIELKLHKSRSPTQYTVHIQATELEQVLQNRAAG